MRRRMPPAPFTTFSSQQLDGKDDQAEKKNKDADPVNTVHVADPFIFWPVRIFLPQVEVFGYLFPDSHGTKLEIGAQLVPLMREITQIYTDLGFAEIMIILYSLSTNSPILFITSSNGG